MQFLKPFALLLFSAALVFSCKNTQPPADKALVITNQTLQQSAGRDCDKPDSLQTNCAQIDLSWPVVQDGTDSLKKSVANWSEQFLIGLLMPEPDSTAPAVTDVKSAAQAFFKLHAEWTKGMEDSPTGNYTAESQDTVLLNDGKHLTLSISSYVYTGGAHGMPMNNTATFDVKSGKLLRWSDLVSDTTALQAIAEKKFREERADVFKPTTEDGEAFEFDDVFQFALPTSYGLTEKGIFFFYNPYEVTPYALGSTVFVIPFGELEGLVK